MSLTNSTIARIPVINSGKILIIDDDPKSVKLLKLYLQDFYDNVEVATNGTEGLKKAKKFLPDIILLDIMMPDMNGYEVCQKIKENHQLFPYTKIILLSAKAYKEDRLKGYEAGADDYLTKPYEEEVLLAKVKILLNNILAEKYLKNEILIKDRELQKTLLVDRNTNLPNYAKFCLDVKKMEDFSLFLLNIDSFTNIKLAFGIDSGYQVLKQVSRKLLIMLDKKVRLYHYSSDQFLIISQIPNLDLVKFATLINKSINNKPIEYKEFTINIQFSIGIVKNKQDFLIEKASIAVQKARKRGRGKVEVFYEDPEWTKQYKKNISWTAKVKHALENKSFIPYFQGIHHNKKNTITKYECLIRLVDRDRIILPQDFMQPAIQAGMAHDITRFMIENSFKFFHGKDSGFSINLTSEDLVKRNFSNFVKLNLNQYELRPENITFEVLENVNTNHNAMVIKNLHKLKDMGFKIAIDDFGTEFSNFASILEINPDFIKIDGSFIKVLDQKKNAYKIAKYITQFAHSIGAEVIAEYVHTKEIQEKVIELGIDYSQGYLFSKPTPDLIKKHLIALA